METKTLITKNSNFSIGQYVKNMRDQMGVNQAELAKMLGYKEASQLSRIESGKEKLPLKAYKILIEKLDLDPKIMLALYLSYSTEKFYEALK